MPLAAPPGRRLVVLASAGVLLAAADTYVVVLALPDIMTGIGLGLDELHRATPLITGFLLGYITALPLVGRLADVRGRVPVLVGCLLLFSLGSLLTATADGLAVAVAGRALQGVGGGGLVPATLAAVADVWPPHRRGLPLGAVGGVQEAGSVLGPLYGAAVLAVSGWRAIFVVNLVVGLALAAAIGASSRVGGRGERHPRDAVRSAASIAAALAFACLLLVIMQPATLTSSVSLGGAFVPVVGESEWTSPLAVAGVLLAVGAAGLVGRTSSRRHDPAASASPLDIPGAVLLAAALAGVVLAFATADPSRQAIADDGPLLLVGSAAAAALFVVRQRMARFPLVPRGSLNQRCAWGAVLVNVFVGGALVVALVNVPIFARATRFPDSQLGAALTLVQLLAALSVGAVVGGWALVRVAPRWIAALGLALTVGGFVAMASWDAGALFGVGAAVALVGTGLGFGLAVAPVNAALLAGTDAAVHGVASALAVVARMVGMLTGLSLLAAVGLHVFYRDQAEIGTPLELCPNTPGDCPAYEEATRDALIHELSVMFSGAAVCALVAAVLAAALLAPPVPAGQRRTSARS